MKPASRKPIVISFQSIVQSARKPCATAVHLPSSSSPPCSWQPCVCSSCASWACARACSSSRGETKKRSSTAISTIRMMPPTYSASANCQPISTQRTRPSSQTRLVEANWKASAVVAEAPLAISERAIEIAA